MNDIKPRKRSKTKTEINRAWKERNADRNKHLGLVIPRTAHEVWQQAGEKSGLSMAGLMLACLGFLAESDGGSLRDLAAQHGKRHGLRVRIEGPSTGQVLRIRAGRFRKGAANA